MNVKCSIYKLSRGHLEKRLLSAMVDRIRLDRKHIYQKPLIFQSFSEALPSERHCQKKIDFDDVVALS